MRQKPCANMCKEINLKAYCSPITAQLATKQVDINEFLQNYFHAIVQNFEWVLLKIKLIEECYSTSKENSHKLHDT